MSGVHPARVAVRSARGGLPGLTGTLCPAASRRSARREGEPGVSPRIPGTAGSFRLGRRPAPCSAAVPRAAARPACSGPPDPVATAKIRLAVFYWPRPALRASWAPARECSSRSSGSRRRRPGPGRGRRFISSVLCHVMQRCRPACGQPQSCAARRRVASGMSGRDVGPLDDAALRQTPPAPMVLASEGRSALATRARCRQAERTKTKYRTVMSHDRGQCGDSGCPPVPARNVP